MAVKYTVLVIGVAAALLGSADAASADPRTAIDLADQYRFAEQGSAASQAEQTPQAAAAVRFTRQSGFGLPGAHVAPAQPSGGGNPHWGPAEDADDN